MNAFAQLDDWSQAAASPVPGYLSLGPARSRFVGLLIDRILAIETYRQQVMHRDTALEAIKSISALSHKIGGVAATLGYDKIGDYAKFVEHNVEAGLYRKIDPQHIYEMVAEPLESLLGAMETALEDETPLG